jgi:uncharacterized protein YndB with AHSA1/START domain
MNERSVTHATFVLERTYDASPARVFAAFASPEAKRAWFVGPDEYKKSDHTLDFRVGGREHVSGGAPGGPTFRFDATIQDIVPDQRIVTSYDMHMDDARISVSLATVELHAAGAGTRLTYTEQGAFLDGFDSVESREEGTAGLLDKLGAALEQTRAEATA